MDVETDVQYTGTGGCIHVEKHDTGGELSANDEDWVHICRNSCINVGTRVYVYSVYMRMTECLRRS